MIAGPSGCNSTLQLSDSLTSLKNQIINQAIIPCDEITWSIIGISAASINSLLLFILLIFNTILLIFVSNVINNVNYMLTNVLPLNSM